MDASTIANVANVVINALGLQLSSSSGEAGSSSSGGAGSSNLRNSRGNRITRYGDCFVASIFGNKQFLAFARTFGNSTVWLKLTHMGPSIIKWVNGIITAVVYYISTDLNIIDGAL